MTARGSRARGAVRRHARSPQPVRVAAHVAQTHGQHAGMSRAESLLRMSCGRDTRIKVLGVSVAVAPWALILAVGWTSPAAFAKSPTAMAAATSHSSTYDGGSLVIVPLDTPPASKVESSSPTLQAAAPRWLLSAAATPPASVGLSLSPSLPDTAVPNTPPASTIPKVALGAYVRAAQEQETHAPACGLTWPVLAAIGYVESDHARSGGSGSPNWDGIAKPHILGPVLDGSDGYARIPDTDHGVLDGDPTYDRAVGPMQFLPSTWQEYAVSAGGELPANPEDIFDATATAARYLCANGGDLQVPDDLVAAVFSYNHSLPYTETVITVAQRYASGGIADASAALATVDALIAKSSPSSAVSGTSAPRRVPNPSEPAESEPVSSEPPSAPTYAITAPPAPVDDPTPSPTPSPTPAPSADPTATETTDPTVSPTPSPLPTPGSSSPSVPSASPPDVSPVEPPTDSPTETTSLNSAPESEAPASSS